MLGYDVTVHPKAPAVVRAVKDFAYDAAAGQQRALVLWSTGFGAGKTHLARRAAEYLAFIRDEDEYGVSIRRRVNWLSAVDFFGAIKDAYAEGKAVGALFRQWTDGTLFVDDLGKEYVRAESLTWAQEQLYRVIDRLKDNGHSLMLTSNLSPKDLGLLLGGAAWSRILGMCRDQQAVIDMSEFPDYRVRSFKR